MAQYHEAKVYSTVNFLIYKVLAHTTSTIQIIKLEFIIKPSDLRTDVRTIFMESSCPNLTFQFFEKIISLSNNTHNHAKFHKLLLKLLSFSSLEVYYPTYCIIAKLSSSWQFHRNWAKLALVSIITTHQHTNPPPPWESTKPNLDWAWNRQIV